MKTFLRAMRNRLICTALSLAFLIWHNYSPAALLTETTAQEVAAYAQ